MRSHDQPSDWRTVQPGNIYDTFRLDEFLVGLHPPPVAAGCNFFCCKESFKAGLKILHSPVSPAPLYGETDGLASPCQIPEFYFAFRAARRVFRCGATCGVGGVANIRLMTSRIFARASVSLGSADFLGMGPKDTPA